MLLGADVVHPPTAAELHDATETRGLTGVCDAVLRPTSAQQTLEAVRWCYAHDVPMTPRGGGTGFAGGAVPLAGGVIIDLGDLRAVRTLEPLLWRAHVEAGLRTAELRRLARENGLVFPPDPGAAEQSQIGGNIATNAGGPHAFKYGVTGHWVMGLEAVIPPGELIEVGGPLRKDVAGYDLKSLLVGSEGTLGVVTAAWLKLLPAPEAAYPIMAAFPDIASGCEAIETVLGLGLDVAAVEYLDPTTLRLAGGSLPWSRPPESAFAVIVEVDGAEATARHNRDELLDAWAESSLSLTAPLDRREIDALWRWRDGVSLAVTTFCGGKISEDIVVPLDRLRDAIEGTLAIGAAHDLPACSWGHAGDGNLHSTFMIDPSDHGRVERAEQAAEHLFQLAVELGGSISGEHGLGLVKAGQLRRQWAPAAVRMHEEIKRAFDPKGLMNPGKKLA